MSKRYYIKHPPHPSSHSTPILKYIFIAVNSAAFALALVFFNPMNIMGLNPTYVSEAESPQVQGVAHTTESLPSVPTNPPEQVSTPISSPTPTPITLKKKSYRVAVYGDSMVDTMGELLEYMDHELKRKYPNNTFGLYNYGVGSQNVEEGLARFHKEFSYNTRNYPPITQIKADVIIIGSFAYNPFTPHDRDKHWLTLTHLVQEAQRTGARVYLLAEIAPLRRNFGKGPNGVNWSDDASYTQSKRIVEQLENAIGLAQTLRVPLINAYEASLDGKPEVDKKYINSSDGIHASVEGHELTAKHIIDALQFDSE